jgi:hypothetical protein
MPISVQTTTVAGAPNAITTLTIPAAGTGFGTLYLDSLSIYRIATAALAGGAILTITSTNLPGGPSWRVGNNMIAGGTQIDIDDQYVQSIKAAAAGTAITIVMPAAGAAVSWHAVATWHVGPS